MSRHKLPERSFIFEMPDGSEIVGYPLTIAHERAFLRDGTSATISAGNDKDPEAFYSACLRYIAASLRKDEAFVERAFTPEQAGTVLGVILTESHPKPEGRVGPEAQSP